MKTFLFALVIAAGCRGAEDGETTPCQRLRDHLIDLRLNETNSNKVDHGAHRKAMKRSLGDNFLRGCEQTITTTKLRCALDATDSTAATACAKISGTR